MNDAGDQRRESLISSIRRAYHVLPPPCRRVIGRVIRPHTWFIPTPLHDPEILRSLWSITSGQVAAGPFAGLQTSGRSAGSSFLPKLLGTYEQELHGLWNPDVLKQFRMVVNVGCAEGFYLAGIGHLLRRHGLAVPLLCGFDLNEAALSLARDLLATNGFESAVFGTDGWAECLADGPDPALVLCDIEGAEVAVLDPRAVPRLRTATILCEVHDDPGDTATRDLLIGRFRDSHHIHGFDSRRRTVADFPPLKGHRFSTATKLAAMNERRVRGNHWLHLVPRAADASPRNGA